MIKIDATLHLVQGKIFPQLTPNSLYQLEMVLKGEAELSDYHDELYYELYEHFNDVMPYGTAKARDGDPYEWMFNMLEKCVKLGIIEYS